MSEHIKTTETLPKTYDPVKTEGKWYKFWENQGYFTAKVDREKQPFCIVIPPPNVTGSLHMGHALNNTIQDLLIRRQRMLGKAVLWLPGTDHAGIATQNKVEQQLAKEGLTRFNLGREKFIDRVWQWRNKYGHTIIHQLKRLGCSCDWKRERFTMDEGYSQAIREVFVHLYKEGLIYRGKRIINWCPRCHTALSDIEVEHEDIEGKFWYIRYPLLDNDGYLVIATTRPETMLGDTAVAVNPNDKRYKKFIGKKARLPLIGRQLPIIADKHVDPDFGTGALKVTPAHDPYDFEIGKRHNLKQVNILAADGSINENGGQFKGMDRFQARQAVVASLQEQGLLEKVTSTKHAVGHCYRCHTVIEPYLSKQWFVNMQPLAEMAIKVVEQEKIHFFPSKWRKHYLNWMQNIRDWCISRQIWWGHQIPAWYCQNCNEVVVELKNPKSCPKCGRNNLKQDQDVLDTWFSSALWPFATLGWPDKTKDLDYFYPTSVLSTARDILYLWVARMIMMGLKFANDIPFKQVVIHPTVLNFEGRRMSKSLGTGVDPLELIDTYGTDATRFGLMVQSTSLQDMRFVEDRLEMSRNFANKIWNASRFVLMNLDPAKYQPIEAPDLKETTDRWIISRLQRLIIEVDKHLEDFNFSAASKAIYNFFWSQFCDWYLEFAKNQLVKERAENRGNNQAVTQNVLVYILDNVLRLLHPFMPFITEEIWQKLPGAAEGQKIAKIDKKAKPSSIMIAPWPIAKKELINEKIEKEMATVQAVITAIRTLRSELNLPPSIKIKAFIKTGSEKQTRLLKSHQEPIGQLAKVEKLAIDKRITRPSKSAVAIIGSLEIFLPLKDLIDIEQEVAHIEKSLQAVEEQLLKIDKKLANKNFVEKAPLKVVENQKNKQGQLLAKQAKLKEQLSMLKS
jgi:valyl-tRNA synthetase